jgi:hypothetical protein
MRQGIRHAAIVITSGCQARLVSGLWFLERAGAIIPYLTSLTISNASRMRGARERRLPLPRGCGPC